MGLIDVAHVNMFVLHCESMKKKGEKPLTHAVFRRTLSSELLSIHTDEMLTDDCNYGVGVPVASGSDKDAIIDKIPTPKQHVAIRLKDKRDGLAQLKQKACTVCS